jgi:hypothetical protein
MTWAMSLGREPGACRRLDRKAAERTMPAASSTAAACSVFETE